MAIEINLLDSASNLSAALEELKDRTVVVIGAVGTGKTWLARCLLRLAKDSSRATLSSANMGSHGPECLARAGNIAAVGTAGIFEKRPIWSHCRSYLNSPN